MKKGKKTSEERFLDKEADNLVKYIIAATFARHSKMSEEDYLKDIGFADSGKTEAEAIRISIFNVLTETTAELLKAKQTIKSTHALMRACLIDENITEEPKGE